MESDYDDNLIDGKPWITTGWHEVEFDSSPYDMPEVNEGGYTLTDEEASADAREDEDE